LRVWTPEITGTIRTVPDFPNMNSAEKLEEDAFWRVEFEGK
jgi:hypothetical protein